MEEQKYSIFNDIIGPVMRGPSSSHTAAPARIAYMVRHLLASEPKAVEFQFDNKGSFATTYETQGSDRGFVGGLMGCMPDDERLLNALPIAKEKGLSFKFVVTNFEAPHPNTVRIIVESEDGERVRATGISTGGGMMEILEVDGFPVSMNGKNYELILIMPKEHYDMAVENVVQEYEWLETFEKGKDVLINLKLAYPPEKSLIKKLSEKYSSGKVRVIPPVYSVLTGKCCKVPFKTALEMDEMSKNSNLAPWELGLQYEMSYGRLNKEEAMEKMLHVVEVMEGSIQAALSSNRPGKLIKPRSGDYIRLAKEGRLVSTGAMDTAIAWSMAMVETNSYYGTVVAAPTSGACGTVPGAVLGVAEHLGKTKEEKAKALFASGAIGLAIAYGGTFAAEVCGCQAECGAASSMAAAGIVQLMGGTATQANGAASIALQNVLGMICDSVAGLVEVPCLGRNVLGAVNAISTANMVMAGVEEIIPLDEVIRAMMEVGKLMPSELCCTNSGGLAITETSRKLAFEIENRRNEKH